MPAATARRAEPNARCSVPYAGLNLECGAMLATPTSTRALMVGFQTCCSRAAARVPNFAQDAGVGANPTIPEPNKTLIPTVNIAPAKGWPEGDKAEAGRRPRGQRLRLRARSSALALCAAQRRRAGRRNQRSGAAGRHTRHQGLRLQDGAEARGLRRAERQPHHAAARRRWRWHRGNPHHLPARAQLAVRHGARRPRLLCGEHGCGDAVFLRRGRHDTSARRA